MAKQGKVGPVEVYFRQHTAGEGWGVGVDHGEVAGRRGGGRERTTMRERVARSKHHVPSVFGPL